MSRSGASGSSARTVHVPVLLREVLQMLELRPGLTVVDGTVGAGGHSQLILPRIQPAGRLIGIDRDATMLARAAQVVSGTEVSLIQGSYLALPAILQSLGIETVDRLLLDLGLSSDQLADPQRGFGFQTTAPLDMRFDASTGESVAELIRRITLAELIELLDEYGEEPQARKVAQEILRRRDQQAMTTAQDLREAVETALGHRGSGSHPATRIFQAFRIAVNQELRHLETFLNSVLATVLKPGGRAVIITFHSLEDRLVKHAFREDLLWDNLTRKPVEACPAEVRLNPRSRSAKLRVAVRKDSTG